MTIFRSRYASHHLAAREPETGFGLIVCVLCAIEMLGVGVGFWHFGSAVQKAIFTASMLAGLAMAELCWRRQQKDGSVFSDSMYRPCDLCNLSVLRYARSAQFRPAAEFAFGESACG